MTPAQTVAATKNALFSSSDGHESPSDNLIKAAECRFIYLATGCSSSISTAFPSKLAIMPVGFFFPANRVV